ncbi:MAG: hypothetical protein D6698_14315 [Gammaproteobacteria bacterium]|nr:MAG: hypothetical protein D6698_14315 [Gammaproteobacteria bacterium]
MKKILVLVLLVLLAACATNTTPLAKSYDSISTIAINALDTVKSLVEQSTGLDPKVKEKILEKVEVERKKVEALKASSMALLSEMGEIDWEQIIKDELKEVDLDALAKELLEILKKKLGV